jgi:hypothetical protein
MSMPFFFLLGDFKPSPPLGAQISKVCLFPWQWLATGNSNKEVHKADAHAVLCLQDEYFAIFAQQHGTMSGCSSNHDSHTSPINDMIELNVLVILSECCDGSIWGGRWGSGNGGDG